MTTFNTPLQQVATEIKRLENVIEMANELEKLHSNKQFKKVILEGLFEKLPVQLVPLLAHPVTNEVTRKGLELQLQGVGTLQNYFSSIYRQAEAAGEELKQLHEMQAELLSEGE